jgi:hypothetical protein
MLGDDSRGLGSARQRAVDDAYETGVAQLFTERVGLRPAQRAEVKPLEVAVQDVVRILDVRVPDEEDAGQLRYAPTVVRFVPAERPESRALYASRRRLPVYSRRFKTPASSIGR